MWLVPFAGLDMLPGLDHEDADPRSCLGIEEPNVSPLPVGTITAKLHKISNKITHACSRLPDTMPNFREAEVDVPNRIGRHACDEDGLRSGADRLEMDFLEEAGSECRNQGSFGHPDFCSRACLYYAHGDCSNGRSCSFCHMQHPKRSAHLDKRHREMLKDMSLVDRAQLIFPVLQEKVERLHLGSQAAELLDRLWEDVDASAPLEATAESTHPGNREGGRVQRMNKRSLAIVLRAMTVRSLVLMLNGRGDHDDGNPPQECVRSFLQHCRVQSYIKHQKGDTPSASHLYLGNRQASIT